MFIQLAEVRVFSFVKKRERRKKEKKEGTSEGLRQVPSPKAVRGLQELRPALLTVLSSSKATG